MEIDLGGLDPDLEAMGDDAPRTTVVITGASGNLRPHSCGRPGRDLYDLVLFDSRPDPEVPDLIVADLAEASPDWMECFHGADVVVHLAANASDRATWEELYRPNVDATFNVLNAAVLAGVERFIFASSNHAMGGYRHLGEGPITVDLTPIPGNPYGGTKLMGERLGRAAAAAYGITFVALRIGWVQPGENLPATLPDDWSWKLWLSNDDFLRLMDAALDADLEPGTFLVVNGMSRNRGTRWDLESSRQSIGFEPADDSFQVG